MLATRSTDTDDSENGYVLFQVEITDRDRYKTEYIPTALETVEAHGGRVLVGEDDPQVLEGEWDYNWTVVLVFPSVEAARSWSETDAYEAVRSIRHDASSAENVVITPCRPRSGSIAERSPLVYASRVTGGFTPAG